MLSGLSRLQNAIYAISNYEWGEHSRLEARMKDVYQDKTQDALMQM